MENKMCRICLDTEGLLITPCNCCGTIGYMHELCLMKWLSNKSDNSCEICKHEYQFGVRFNNAIRMLLYFYNIFAFCFVCLPFIIVGLSISVIIVQFFLYNAYIILDNFNYYEISFFVDKLCSYNCIFDIYMFLLYFQKFN